MARPTPEGRFKTEFHKTLIETFPGCVLLKNDEMMLQGVPDTLLLWGRYWAMLEFKASASAERQPNQDYWVDKFGEMSFAAFVYPENAEEILRALQLAFRPRRTTRISQR